MTAPAAPVALVTLAEAKAHLNAVSSTTDAELGMYVEAVTDVIEQYAGAVLPRTVTEVVRSRVLRQSPVLSVLSVTRNGLAVTDFTFDAASGLLDGSRLVGATVTYTAGRAPIPAAIKLAALVTLSSVWETQRGSQPLPLSGNGEDGGPFTPRGVPDLPYRAQMLLAPYRRGQRVG